MRKRDLISELVRETAKRMVWDGESWRKYLNTASRIYKYPFREQICIYAQRPDAEACASMKEWNEVMHCWVNGGAKGIALLDDEVPYTGLKHVFDISDVHKLKGNGRFPYIWVMREEHKEAVIGRLEELYGETVKESGFGDRIKEIAGRIAEDVYEQAADEMGYTCAGSYLEEYDELNFKLRIRETLAGSIAYTILRRCGVGEAELAEEISFPYIFEFNTLGTLSVLGDSISKNAMPVLIEIKKVVRAYDRELAKNHEAEKNNGKVQNGLASITARDYNTLKRESDRREPESRDKEKGEQNGSEIREKRGLPDSGITGGQTAGRGADEIRPDAEGLPERAQERDLYGASAGREAERTFADGSETGGGEDGRYDRTDDGTERGKRTAQSREPVTLGSENERNQAGGGGDSSGRVDIQLNIGEQKPEDSISAGFSFGDFLKGPAGVGASPSRKKGSKKKAQKEEYVQLSLFPTVGEQMGTVMSAGVDVNASASMLLPVQDKYIEGILWTGGGRKGSKERICSQYQAGGRAEEISEFLAGEYGTGGKGVEIDGQEVCTWFDREGMRFAYGTAAKEDYSVFLTWEMAEKRIRAMVESHTYMDNKDKTVQWREFITQDEINEVLVRGSGADKRRIYEFFSQNHFPKENADFLRREYGTRGYGGALPGTDSSFAGYSPKGIKLAKGSLIAPVAEVLVNWRSAEKCIRMLIAKGSYLNAEEMEDYARYRQGHREAGRAGSESGSREQAEISGKPEAVRGEAVTAGDRAEAVNFRIVSGEEEKVRLPLKEKFRKNVEVVRLLKEIESENRPALPKEQEVLSQYAGWGGLADAFDENKGGWKEEYQELKGLLSEEEYAVARASTLNAYYTPDAVIRAIYEVIDKMGFQRGKILEPSVGTGKFFGMLPEKMLGSRLYGAELDSLTGRIAKMLYPKANIEIAGFEETAYPDGFFDAVVGNVPFGGYKVVDRQYDKYNFLIHDYFFAKAIDKVRAGGIVAMVTTNGMGGGTFDKKDSRARRYFAQRCDLLGAIRLPERTFEDTDITTDILFFQKRERQRDLSASLPEWVETSVVYEGDYVKENGENGHSRLYMNNYFLAHPEMVLGKMEVTSGPFGPQMKCLPVEGSLGEKLGKAASNIRGQIETVEADIDEKEAEEELLPAEPGVKNFSYALVDNRIYYRENTVMKPVKVSDTAEKRIRGMLAIHGCVQELLKIQMEESEDSAVREKQELLGRLYDGYVERFGRINDRANRLAFGQDSGYFLLCSLEKLDEDGKFAGKADIFTKRTIKRRTVITGVDTSAEALAVSLNEKGMIDLDYMSALTGRDKGKVAEELSGVIFRNPVTEKWETADEYLSGNVRVKLETAKAFADNKGEYAVNVAALKKVQPRDLEASEIEVTLGATWIEPEYVRDFMYETFEVPELYIRHKLSDVRYIKATDQWVIKGKNVNEDSATVKVTYGTGRANAYRLLEDALNLRSTRIYDLVKTEDGEKRVLNRTETVLAGQKQEVIKNAFKEWIFAEPERRRALCEKYNRLFNSVRPREYDGSHLTFPEMSPEYHLEPYQANAVAHQIYGKNTLLAHCVGAGKTFEMVAAAMESRRLGLCSKSLFVVPNHLTMQWAGDFLRLYPGANILAVTKRDFEPANRKKFCSRIAMGDFDAVIIGHSQFEKIPLSVERQIMIIERQIEEIQESIREMKAANGENYGIKQMEKTRKSLEARLKKLNDNTRKDDVITFEQLGVDRLFVDESHFYKNLFLFTKMRNVAGISQTEAQKSSDMFAKCRYMDELTGGRGITFATGTPISNSMCELYTNMRYLQYDALQESGWEHFDSWASTFGETQEVRELSPEGTGYRTKTRFSRFFNLPELMAVFKECADIQTADMLKLPVLEAVYENVVLKPSACQKEAIQNLAERAENVRGGGVNPAVDNMLKITNDGRKLALDQRIIDGSYPDDAGSKVSACAERAFRIWEQGKAGKLTQLIFSDLSTPKGDGAFNVYEDIRDKLVKKGVPEREIAFIHDAGTDAKKAELFAKVRSGQVRFLLGSTQKMGAGTNVQDRLAALHHLDVPWRPSDIEQREGRIIRRNNLNSEVKIFRYVTEETFDAYMWQVLENKQKFISQVMTSKSPVRSCEDVDEASLSYAEVKALATGNPLIKERMDLDMQVARLKLLKASYTSQRYRLEDDIALRYPGKIMNLKARIEGYEADMATFAENKASDADKFFMKLNGKVFTEKKEAGAVLLASCLWLKSIDRVVNIGEYCGFQVGYTCDSVFYDSSKRFILKGRLSHRVSAGEDALGNITRINHVLESMEDELRLLRIDLAEAEKNFEAAKKAVEKPFLQEQELREKLERLEELDALLEEDKEEEKAGVCIREEAEAGAGAKEGRISVKEKLKEMGMRAAQQRISGDLSPGKNREDSL